MPCLLLFGISLHHRRKVFWGLGLPVVGHLWRSGIELAPEHYPGGFHLWPLLFLLCSRPLILIAFVLWESLWSRSRYYLGYHKPIVFSEVFCEIFTFVMGRFGLIYTPPPIFYSINETAHNDKFSVSTYTSYISLCSTAVSKESYIVEKDDDTYPNPYV